LDTRLLNPINNVYTLREADIRITYGIKVLSAVIILFSISGSADTELDCEKNIKKICWVKIKNLEWKIYFNWNTLLILFCFYFLDISIPHIPSLFNVAAYAVNKDIEFWKLHQAWEQQKIIIINNNNMYLLTQWKANNFITLL